jgi:hypothetical protein
MRCEICGLQPCQTEGFCRFCRQVDARNKADPPPLPELPAYAESMDAGSLWDALNNPARHNDTAQSTYDAVEWSLVHNNGLRNPQVRSANLRRLSLFSDRQLKRLIGVLAKRGCAPEMIAEIEGYL